MTTHATPIAVDPLALLDPLGHARTFFNAGQLAAGMASLSLAMEGMADRATDSDIQERLAACGKAAARFALEWAGLSERSATKCVELLLTRTRAAWVPCPDCEEFFCRIHLLHVYDCECPPVEDWALDPYTLGGPEPKPFNRRASATAR